MAKETKAIEAPEEEKVVAKKKVAAKKAVGTNTVPFTGEPIPAWKTAPKGMKVPNKTGYMDKERLESEELSRRHLGWLKVAEEESKGIRKCFVASNREYAKTLGKFDDYRDKVRKMHWYKGFKGLPLSKETWG